MRMKFKEPLFNERIYLDLYSHLSIYLSILHHDLDWSLHQMLSGQPKCFGFAGSANPTQLGLAFLQSLDLVNLPDKILRAPG